MNTIPLTSDQFEDFKKLAYYLICLHEPNINLSKMSKEEEHRRVGELSSYGTETIRNKYSEKNPKLRVENFNYFCHSFLTTFYTKGDTQPHSKDKTYKTFIRWVENICKDHNCSNPVEHYQSSNNFHVSGGRAKNSKKDIATFIVEKYYTSLESHEYSEAWKLLAFDFQNKRWPDKYSSFKRFYKEKEIRLPKILEAVELDESLFEFQIGYVYKIITVDNFFEEAANFDDKLGLLPELLLNIEKIKDGNYKPLFRDQFFADLCVCKFQGNTCLINNIRSVVTRSQFKAALAYIPDVTEQLQELIHNSISALPKSI